MRKILLFVDIIFKNMVFIIFLGLIPGLLVILAADCLVPSFTGIPDRNIPADFTTAYEVAVAKWYGLFLLFLALVVTTTSKMRICQKN